VSRRKLLLADDSITIQKVVNLTFADEGIDVVTVGDGDAALAQLSSETPDIVLADVNMPGPTGYQICERLRANESTRSLPVILLVGSFEPFDEAEATRVGANAYLTKPFQSIKQLIQQVNELIDTAPQQTEEVEPVIAEVSSDVPDAETATVEQVVSESADSVTADAAVVTEPVESEPDPAETAAPRNFDDLGYETATPAADAPRQTPSEDIDNLYERSLSSGSDAELSDVGIDDEMIETSYSAPESTEQIGTFEQETSSSDAFEASAVESEKVAEPVEEQPLTSTETEVGFRSGYDQRFPDDPSKFENTISYENWKPADMRPGEPEIPAASLETAETEPLSVPPSPPAETESQASVPEDTIRMENRFETTGSASYQFDDVDLLDLSGDNAAPVEITSPVNAVEQGSSKQLVTLSPELIEMIAQRVVEKMSEKY